MIDRLSREKVHAQMLIIGTRGAARDYWCGYCAALAALPDDDSVVDSVKRGYQDGVLFLEGQRPAICESPGPTIEPGLSMVFSGYSVDKDGGQTQAIPDVQVTWSREKLLAEMKSLKRQQRKVSGSPREQVNRQIVLDGIARMLDELTKGNTLSTGMETAAHEGQIVKVVRHAEDAIELKPMRARLEKQRRERV